ncbi:MAG: hypothetical protein ACYTGL_11920 [Planctomycetota bacterium]
MFELRRFWLFSMFAAVVLTLQVGLSPAIAQDEEETEGTRELARPVATINLASVDTALQRADYVFGSIDRSEITDLIAFKLSDVRDLKGINRELPAGVMIFLSEGIVPLPNPVGYLPVDDIGEFGQTLETVGAQLKKLPEADDMYELIPQRGVSQYVSLQNGYAFIGQSIDTVDRPFASPAEFGKALAEKYDICASANLRNTPDHIRELVLTTLRNSTQAAMQRRDEEPEGAYRIRRAQAEGNLHFVESLLKDGEELTIGFKVDPEANHAFLEMVVRAKPDTAFAEELLESVGKPSRFSPALDATVPLSLSLSAVVNEHQRKTLAELFNVGQQEISRELSQLPQDTPKEEIPELESVRGLFDSLRATIKEGHLDGFVQFFGNVEDNFVLAGGVKLVDAAGFGNGLAAVLERASEFAADTEVEVAFASHGDVVFHRIKGETSSRGDRAMYGEAPTLYVGTDSQAIWFAVGGENALPTLRAAIDKVNAGQLSAPDKEQAPFEFVMNMNHWVKLGAKTRDAAMEAAREARAKAEAAQAEAARNAGRPVPTRTEREEPGGRRRRGPRFNELASQAFEEPGSDVLRVDSRPIENGFRIRAQFENGFLRLIGLAIAGQIDRQTDL